MKTAVYGQSEQTLATDPLSQHVEAIRMRGYTVLYDLFPAGALAAWRTKIDAVYAQQEGEFGREALAAIQELDVCRAPLLYDFDFMELVSHPRILEVVQRFLGEWFILNLQNAVINRPGTEHHQASWHRDLPHQNFVISRPLGINALFAFDAFSEETGGTHFLPFSHKSEILPSEAYIRDNQMIAHIPAGAAIVFDPMLFHRTGSNRSQGVRRAVNQLYTVPIIKQQYDFPRALGERGLDAAAARLLGYTAQVPLDDKMWRRARADRQQRKAS